MSIFGECTFDGSFVESYSCCLLFSFSEWRDIFPKSNMNGGYVGDRYEICSDQPERQHLRKGATYRLLGGRDQPELHNDP